MRSVCFAASLLLTTLISCTSEKAAKSGFDSAKQGKDIVSQPIAISNNTAVPDWVPIYPGSKITKVDVEKAGYDTKTQIQIEAPAKCTVVGNWYQDKLRLANFDVGGDSGYTNGYCSSIMTATAAGGRTLRIGGNGAGPGPDDRASTFTLNAIVSEAPGQNTVPATGAQVPAWVPRYPGSGPENVEIENYDHDRRVHFNQKTSDDNHKIIAWYEQTLKSGGFTIVSSMADNGGYGRIVANNATGRSNVTLRVEPADGKEVIFMEARDGGN